MKKLLILSLSLAFISIQATERKRDADKAEAGKTENYVIVPAAIVEELNKFNWLRSDRDIIEEWLKQDPKNLNARVLESDGEVEPLLTYIIGFGDQIDPSRYEKNRDLFDSLISRGVDVNAIGDNGWSALMTAAYLGKLDLVRKLLQAKANANYINITTGALSRGETPLTAALSGQGQGKWKAGMNDVIKLLIGAGANVNYSNQDGITPLMQALRLKDLTSARLLLEHGADIEAIDNDGKTVMDHAKEIDADNKVGSNGPGAVKLIYEFKKKRKKEAKENTQRAEALSGTLPPPVIKITKEYMMPQTGKKATLNQMKKAIREDDFHALGYLATEEGNLELADEQGYTPLLEAIYSNKPALVKLLLELGADKGAHIGGLNALRLAEHLRATRSDFDEQGKKNIEEIIKLLQGSATVSLTPVSQMSLEQ